MLRCSGWKNSGGRARKTDVTDALKRASVAQRQTDRFVQQKHQSHRWCPRQDSTDQLAALRQYLGRNLNQLLAERRKIIRRSRFSPVAFSASPLVTKTATTITSFVTMPLFRWRQGAHRQRIGTKTMTSTLRWPVPRCHSLEFR